MSDTAKNTADYALNGEGAPLGYTPLLSINGDDKEDISVTLGGLSAILTAMSIAGSAAAHRKMSDAYAILGGLVDAVHERIGEEDI